LAGSKERERRRARERFEQQRSARLERQRRNRKRAGIGLAVLCVLGLIAGVTTILVGLRHRFRLSRRGHRARDPLQLHVGVGRHGGQGGPADRVAGLQGGLHGVDQYEPGSDQDRFGELEGDVHRQLIRPSGLV
jgi:hypothetical protein